MHWPCGPLAAARLAAKQSLTPELKETLAAWADPRSLQFIKGTPVNCLVVPWAAGKPDDKEHQETLGALVQAGIASGLSLVGDVTAKSDLGIIIEAGLKSGLSGFMVPTLDGLPKDAPVIVRAPRSEVPWASATSPLAITENQWPGLALDTTKGDTAQGGPTGVPWVNSNGWYSLLARKLSRGKTIWLEYDPPDSSDLAHPASYTLAIADGAAYGSRWAISLDGQLRGGLTRKDTRAASTWGKIAACLEFFKEKEAWFAFQPEGSLAVISSYRGDDEFMAAEILNLLARRFVQFRIIERSEAAVWPLTGLKAVLWVDSAGPSAETRAKLAAFVQQGGLLITPTNWGLSRANPTAGGILDRYEVRALGKGRVAVAKEGFKDPYDVAVDTHLLLSRRNDWARVFNITAANTYCCADPQRHRRLVQVLNYASSEPEHPVSVWVRTTNRTARFWKLGEKQLVTLRGIPAVGGMEFQLPSFLAYAALEFELRGV